MLKQIYNSLAFRSAGIYKALLSKWPAPNIDKPINEELKMISLCGKGHIGFLKQSLNSVLYSFHKIPVIEIYTDGSMAPQSLQEELSAYSKYVKVLDWESCITNDTSDEQKLADFARKHPIGRKLLVISFNSNIKPTLWWDTDILWFKDISQLSLPHATGIFQVKTTEDYQPAYSENMLPAFPEHSEKPYINTGLVYMTGNLFKENDFTDLLDIASTKPNHFSEQTILARTVLSSTKDTWPLDKIACKQTDQLTMAPTYPKQNWVARHYVGPVRHLFWRDAFFLRMGVKP